MGTAIQIAVAAALVMAWVWVLGRPLVKGLLQLLAGSDPTEPERADIDPDMWGDESRPSWFGWRDKPAVVRRRQLLLATLFAAFGSFLLAVALRGRFVYLFALMVVVLMLHLGVAAHLGGRIVAAREEARREAARRQVVAGRGTTIRAARAGAGGPDEALTAADAAALAARYPLPDLVVGYESPLAGGQRAVSSLVEELIEAEWGTLGADPVPTVDRPAVSTEPAAVEPAAVEPAAVEPAAVKRRTAEPAAAQPGSAGPPAVEPAAIEVDPLIEPEPVEPVVESEPLVEPAAAEPEPWVEPAVEAPAAEEAGQGVDGGEPIFTRPAAQAPARPRRKARPIYIHSHLDEEGFEPPRAVNHP